MIQVSLQADSLEPLQTLNSFQQGKHFSASQCGANALFIGTMRDFNEGDEITAMTLEYYPAMTQKQLEQIAQEASERWALDHVVLAHRVGDILPGDPIVLVSVWSAHRAASFEACRHIMETLKHQAPFWKQEKLRQGGSRWVQKNTAG